ncbi:phosphoribosylglycinamide formyltransferase-1 [Weissella uvarum]|uniref:phosphoribosylglycinamide formyltransferase n=1 Tax=Weissella uvarum TaxID=1479233 RepID=UPI00195FE80E|nr:phosphoribosylglycinamide formyltransferase [Weissella uvarum]MBM7617492.1 phosphoribosylglycinamide formyltransferase-1 [Weissella uvarum]MCM0595624.1 phosphoribosylglycinamide formyltransferase [Weissella uvarum]
MAITTKLAVFASGTGTNFKALLTQIQAQALPAQIVRLVVDHKHAGAIDIAKAANIPVTVVNYQKMGGREQVEIQLCEQLAKDGVQGILLAGYMRILSPIILEAYPQKIINLHPALLPSFPGAHAIEDAFAYGVKITGVTVHYVDEGTDTGKIIDQAAVPILVNDTLATLTKRIHETEHQLYPHVLAQLLKEEVFN